MAEGQPAADLPEPITRERFGRYELLFRLASGGMADLYVGRLRGLKGFERPLVIKVISERYADDPRFVNMLVGEARLAAMIAHPNVVQVLDLGQADDRYYIAMEYVHGESLSALVRRAEIPIPVAARIVSDVAAGLHAAHELRDAEGRLLQVVHRDVSPSNILISYQGVVKLTDFGVARALSNLDVTRVGTIKGKAGYIAPEYLERQIVDRRSDVFALGIVLYEITTRERLYPGEEVASWELVPPSLVREGYPEGLEKIVTRALRVDPDLRYQTARELHDALEQYIVDTGTPVLSSSLSDLMIATFAERMRKKRALLQGGNADLDTPMEVATLSAAGATTSRPSVTAPVRWTRNPPLIAAIAILLLASSILIVTLSRPPSSLLAEPAPPDARTTTPRVAPPAPTPPPAPSAAGARSRAPDARAPVVATRPDSRPAAADAGVLAVVPAAREEEPARRRRPPRPGRPAPRFSRPAPVKPAKPDPPAKAVKATRPAKPADDLFGNPFEKKP